MKRSLHYSISAAILLFVTNSLFAQLPYTQHPEPAGVNITTARMNDLQVDASNNKWMAFATYGLGIYDGSTWTMFNTGNSGISTDSIIAIAFDAGGNAWLGTNVGAVYKAGSVFTIYNTGNSGIPDNIVTTIYSEPGMTWIGTNMGLASFDGTNWTVYNTSTSGIANDSITGILRDAAGRLWVGTRNGLSQYYNNAWFSFTTSNSILDRFIIDIETDYLDRLWVSSGKKAGTQLTQNTTGIHFIDNGSISSFKAAFLNDEPQVYYSNKTNLSRDAAGAVYFRIDLYGMSLMKVFGSDITQYMLPGINYGTAIFGNIFSADSSGMVWTIPNFRFYFYSLDLTNYVPLLGGLSYNNHRTLDINDVEAGINISGDMHWDLSNAQYKVPKDSGKHSVFASALWIGGLDANGQLHTAAQTYRQTGIDYWPGPIGSISVPFDSASCMQFDRIWKMYKWRIEEFKNEFAAGNVSNGTYPVPEEIATWPAKGNGSVNDNLAPFVDFNSDGIYNPMNGDYPDIKGDQMLYYIFNDSLAVHTETGGLRLGVEVQAKAYAFNCTNIVDSNIVLNRTTLYHYTIINRSNNDYDSVYTGFWCDMDLGNAVDDLVGCDTTRSSGFTYNGDNDDETASGYGQNPPMQNIRVLRGTLADPGDGTDNDLDGIIDEPGELTTMNHFMTYNNVNNSPSGNPGGSWDFYYYMQSKWLNGQQLTYGGNGLDTLAPPTNFFFSGVPYDTSGWTDLDFGIPEDRRLLMGSGPVTLQAGDTMTFDIAYVFTWDPLNPNGLTTSIARNQADLDRVQNWFDNNSFPSCEVYTVSLPENPLPENILLYPNPSLQSVTVLLDGKALIDYDYTILNLQGAEVAKGRLHIGGIDLSRLSAQPYFLRIEFPSGPVTQKLIKM